jgi:hypothetical protein
MTKTAQAFEIGQRVTNETGTAWVELKIYQHPSNFYHVYGFTYWAADFDASITEAESTTNMSRPKIERRMRNWLKNR